MAGTVNVSRDLWDDPTFKDSEMSQREAWIWLIASASWKARVKRFGSHEVSLQRGQLAASTRFMAKAWSWSEPRVRRYLEMLENRRMITRVTDAGVTVVSICKYDQYQNAPRVGDAAATQQPTQDRRTTDANHNKGEIRDIHGGGHAREAETLREAILTAIGCDPVSGITGHGGATLGTRIDMQRVAKWQSDLGLTPDAVLAVIRDTMARKRDGPPNNFAYFDRAMQREAGRKDEPALKPIEGTRYDPQSARTDHRAAARSDATDRQIAFAARAVRTPSDDCF